MYSTIFFKTEWLSWNDFSSNPSLFISFSHHARARYLFYFLVSFLPPQKKSKLITMPKCLGEKISHSGLFAHVSCSFPLISYHRFYFEDSHYWPENVIGNWSSLRKWKCSSWIRFLSTPLTFNFPPLFTFSIHYGTFCGLDGILFLFAST